MENPTNNNQTPAEEEKKSQDASAAQEENKEESKENNEGKSIEYHQTLASKLVICTKQNLLTNCLFDAMCVCLGEEQEEPYLLETNWDLEVDNFDDMGLKEEVLRGIYAFGFKDPSPI